MPKKKKASRWDLATLSKKAMLISSIVAALAGTVGGIKTMIESLFSKPAGATASVSNISTSVVLAPVVEPKVVEKGLTTPESKIQNVESNMLEKPFNGSIPGKTARSYGYAVMHSLSIPKSSTALYFALSENASIASTAPTLMVGKTTEQIAPVSIWKKFQNYWWIFLCGGLIVTGIIIWWERRKVKIVIKTEA
jgi:hypothetical protein